MISSGTVTTPELCFIRPEFRDTPPTLTPGGMFPWRQRNLRPIFYDGPLYHGHRTKVFGWLGLPEHATPEHPVPGMVLVHGGAGTAYREWVELWMERGFAAITIDNCGSVPICDPTKPEYQWMKIPHELGGPDGWNAAFEQRNEPLCDQWPFYAINAIAQARTILGACPEVASDRIGITGVSWGGFLTCLSAACDGDRYRFAAPVYGCGFLREKSAWMETLQKPEMENWCRQFDPRYYFDQIHTPMLWVAGTNDFAYPLTSLDQSVRAVKNAPFVLRSIELRMPHGHGGVGESPEIIHCLAKHLLRPDAHPTEAAISHIGAIQRHKQILSVDFGGTAPLVGASLLYTCDSESATQRYDQLLWQVLELPLPAQTSAGSVQATIPAGCKMAFFNLRDVRGFEISSELERFSEK